MPEASFQKWLAPSPRLELSELHEAVSFLTDPDHIGKRVHLLDAQPLSDFPASSLSPVLY